MQHAPLVAWLLAGTLASGAMLWGTSWPLGLPGEWEWQRLPANEASGLNLLLAGLAAGGYAAVVVVGHLRLKARVTRWETGGWLAGLAAAAFAWLWCVQETAPPAGSLGKAAFVLFYPSSSGYFTRVRESAPRGLGAFLAGYEALMREGDVLHIGTHPPGLFCAFYGFAAIVEAVPWAARWLDALQPLSVRESLGVIAENTASSGWPLQPREASILWLAILTAQGLAALSVVPLFGLLRWTQPRATAWLGAALWPTVPAVAVFLPKSDAAFPMLALVIVWLAAGSWRAVRRTSLADNQGAASSAWPTAALSGALLGGFAAGLTAWLGMFCSLAFLPVLAFVALFCVGEWWRLRPPARRLAVWLAALLLGFWLPVLVLSVTARLNLCTVWWWNYRNHAGFYDQYARSYWGWLWRNPLELSLAVGWPIMGAALWTGGHWLSVACRQGWRGLGSSRTVAAMAGVVVWSLLWLTGKNSGEAARLWLLLMPGVVWLAAHVAPSPSPAEDSHRTESISALWSVLVLSLAACIATVHRVGGFHVE
jgi:hypothetical protein